MTPDDYENAMSAIKKHEWYSPCRECGFWVTVKDTYCPNCGVITPRWKIPSATIQIFSKPAMLVGGIGYAVLRTAFLLWKTPGAGLIGTLFGSLVGGVFAGLVFSAAVGVGKFVLQSFKHQKFSKSLQRRSPKSLAVSERAINQRFDEMRTREQQIQETLQDIVRTAKPSPQIIETFQHSLTAIHIQHERYTVKLWEINLIRWYNTLKPLTERVKKMTYDICNARVKNLDTIITQGADMLRQWQDSPTLNQAQQSCIARLTKALETCEQIRQDMLSQKAALAVQGVSPLDEQFQSVPAVLTSLEDLDAFNELPDLGEFTSGFSALEAEYFRLKGEEEVYQEFEQGH